MRKSLSSLSYLCGPIDGSRPPSLLIAKRLVPDLASTLSLNLNSKSQDTMDKDEDNDKDEPNDTVGAKSTAKIACYHASLFQATSQYFQG